MDNRGTLVSGASKASEAHIRPVRRALFPSKTSCGFSNAITSSLSGFCIRVAKMLRGVSISGRVLFAKYMAIIR